MLTVDLVRAYLKKGELQVRHLKGRGRTAALEIARGYLDVMQQASDKRREDLHAELDLVSVPSQIRRVADGLRKLIMDRCDFEMQSTVDPVELREWVFAKSAAVRRSDSSDSPFDRDTVLKSAGERFEQPSERIEELLFADLRTEQKLISYRGISAEQLLIEYDLSQCQAVLLRASEVRVEIAFVSNAAARDLFRRLKFLRLLHRIRRSGTNRYEIAMSGPHALFRSSSKYGLQLAIALRHFFAGGEFKLEADVQWTKAKTPAVFRLASSDLPPGIVAPDLVSDELKLLLKNLKKLSSDWGVRRSTALLQLPGHDICAPDLVFTHEGSGQKVYLEIMGFWSRESVWRRVDLVSEGLKEPIVFAVSERLRVSEKALDDEKTGTIYVYKGVMNAKKVLEKVNSIAARAVVTEGS